MLRRDGFAAIRTAILNAIIFSSTADSIFRKFYSEVARNVTRLYILKLCRFVWDLIGSLARCAPPGGMDFRAISRDFERKILRPRKFFENFGPKSAQNRVQSHTMQHADALHRCCGPLRVVRMLRTTKRHGFRRDLPRFRTRNFADAKI